MHTPPTGRSPSSPNDYTRQGRAQEYNSAPRRTQMQEARLRADTAAEDRARPYLPSHSRDRAAADRLSRGIIHRC